jgi:acyl dehydratase
MSEAIDVGAVGPQRVFGPVSLAHLVRYAGASGDLNPLHFDAAFAQSVGFPAVFSQGMHQAALLATFLTDWLGAETVRRFQVRFCKQVWLGDTLTCSGVVVAVRRERGARLLSLDLTVTRQTGDVVIEGSAEVELPAEEPALSP